MEIECNNNNNINYSKQTNKHLERKCALSKKDDELFIFHLGHRFESHSLHTHVYSIYRLQWQWKINKFYSYAMKQNAAHWNSIFNVSNSGYSVCARVGISFTKPKNSKSIIIVNMSIEQHTANETNAYALTKANYQHSDGLKSSVSQACININSIPFAMIWPNLTHYTLL